MASGTYGYWLVTFFFVLCSTSLFFSLVWSFAAAVNSNSCSSPRFQYDSSLFCLHLWLRLLSTVPCLMAIFFVSQRSLLLPSFSWPRCQHHKQPVCDDFPRFNMTTLYYFSSSPQHGNEPHWTSQPNQSMIWHLSVTVEAANDACLGCSLQAIQPPSRLAYVPGFLSSDDVLVGRI